jgi:hypothetical protein
VRDDIRILQESVHIVVDTPVARVRYDQSPLLAHGALGLLCRTMERGTSVSACVTLFCLRVFNLPVCVRTFVCVCLCLSASICMCLPVSVCV